jgi:hypothetical protein
MRIHYFLLLTCLTLALFQASRLIGQEAFRLEMAVPSQHIAPVMGEWTGSARTPVGETYPFTLILAQWQNQIYGMGELEVNPGNPFEGLPAVRFDGGINGPGNLLVLGMSGKLTNRFYQTETGAFTAEIRHHGDTLSVIDITDNGYPGYIQLVDDFTVVREDFQYQPNSRGILGSWEGSVVTPAGWVFAPIPFWHELKSFWLERSILTGALQTYPSGTAPWYKMRLTEDPVSQMYEYDWMCWYAFAYRGMVMENHFSGILKWYGDPDGEFFGVFSFARTDSFIPPDPYIDDCD